MSKKILIYSILFVFGILTGAGGYYLFFSNVSAESTFNKGETSTQQSTKAGERKVLYWRAPMNPKEIYNHPGKSQMGMELVPVYANNEGESGVVKIDAAIQQDMNVKIEEVKSRKLSPEIITNGILQPDEQTQYVVNTKVSGWIEKLYINYTGQKVRKGDKLIKIYSPELVAAQEEYLTALAYDKALNNAENESSYKSSSNFVKNALRKLQLLDVPNFEINRLKRTKQVRKYITLYAPFNGTVLFKGVEEGSKINRGTPLLKISNLKTLWIIAEIYEYEYSKVKVGLPVEVRFSYLPGKIFRGKISFIYPVLDTKTRTIKVRIIIPNNKRELKPGMFANVVIKGKSNGLYPVVPQEAILRSGRKNRVIIALGNGKFKPVEVKLGIYSDGYYQVLAGLSAGAKVVMSAQFLIDSESSLRAALNKFSGPVLKTGNDSNKTKSKMKMGTKNKNIKTNKEEKIGSGIIRKGIIDLKAIDKNNDGKVFQDVMDWNVISDKPGKCPLCGMKLKEVTINEAKKNLKEHGFQYKN